MKYHIIKFHQSLRQIFENLAYIINIILKTAPLFFILTILFSCFSGLGNVVQSFFISKIIDDILRAKPFLMIALYAVIIIIFQLLSKLQNRTLFAMNRVVTEQISVEMEGRILNLAEHIPLCKMDEPGFLNRMEQARNLTKRTPNSVFMLLFGSIALITGTIGYITILGQINLFYVFILIACSILIFIANNRYEENVMSFLFAMSPERRKMNYYSDLLTKRDSFEELHAYDAMDYLREQYHQNASKQLNTSWSIFKHHTLFYGIAAFIAYTGCALVYLLIIRKAVLGYISIGDMTMFLTACLGFQAGLTELTDGLCSLAPQLNALQSYRDFIAELTKTNTQNEVSASISKTTPNDILVKVKNLSFTYPNSTKSVINHASFHIRHGECIALVGTNGSGKTTLVRLLMGLYDQYDGTIELAGTDIKILSPAEKKSFMSVLFQNYLKPGMTIGEAVTYAPIDKINQNRLQEMLKNSTFPINTLPSGIHTNLTKMFFSDGIIPSGGQWQKLALARMLYRDTPLYILDEPSAALDPQAEDEIFDTLANMKNKHTIIFITHRLASVSMADRILYLTPTGQILQGTHEELMKNCSEYRKLYQLQADKYITKEESTDGK